MKKLLLATLIATMPLTASAEITSDEMFVYDSESRLQWLQPRHSYNISANEMSDFLAVDDNKYFVYRLATITEVLDIQERITGNRTLKKLDYRLPGDTVTDVDKIWAHFKSFEEVVLPADLRYHQVRGLTEPSADHFYNNYREYTSYKQQWGYLKGFRYEKIDFGFLFVADPPNYKDANLGHFLVKHWPLNSPPIITVSNNPASLSEGEAFSTDVIIMDDSDNVDVVLTGLPTGAVYDYDLNTLTWTPDYLQAGNYIIDVTATDDGVPPLSTTTSILISVDQTTTPTGLCTQLTDEISQVNVSLTNAKQYDAHAKKVCGFIATGKLTAATSQLDVLYNTINTDIQNYDIEQYYADRLIALIDELLALIN